MRLAGIPPRFAVQGSPANVRLAWACPYSSLLLMTHVSLAHIQVEEVDGPDVVCRALNDAEMTGLLTVYRMARPAAAGEPPRLQSDLPLLSDYDKMAITVS